MMLIRDFLHSCPGDADLGQQGEQDLRSHLLMSACPKDFFSGVKGKASFISKDVLEAELCGLAKLYPHEKMDYEHRRIQFDFQRCS